MMQSLTGMRTHFLTSGIAQRSGVVLTQSCIRLRDRHVAWMYSRDPLVIYREKLEQDVTTSNDHYENIQSTNWNSVRFKLPPPGSDIGWRVEFRTPELQLTDFENAAFSIFTVLLSRVIIAFNLNLYMPMSKNDANMETAHEVSPWGVSCQQLALGAVESILT